MRAAALLELASRQHGLVEWTQAVSLGEFRLLEVRMARLIKRHGLPMPVYQHVVEPALRVDFAYPELKIAIEVDGFGVRGTAEALSHDLARQNGLVQLGWIVLRFTWHQVVKQPDKVARTVLVTLSPSVTGKA